MSYINNIRDLAIMPPDDNSCGNFEDTIKGCKVYTVKFELEKDLSHIWNSQPQLELNDKIMNIEKSRRRDRVLTFQNEKGFSISIQFETKEQAKLIKKNAKSIAFQ